MFSFGRGVDQPRTCRESGFSVFLRAFSLPVAERRDDRRGWCSTGSGGVKLGVQVLEAEPALDAEIAPRDVVVIGRADLDDLVVLNVQGEIAANSAVGADRVGLGLAGLVPGPSLPQLVLRAEHEGAGGAHRDAVPAVHAGGLGQRVRVFGRDAGVETAPRDRDRKRVLELLAACVDALVAEDAFGVIAYVEIVVDLRRRVHGGGALTVGTLVVAGALAVALGIRGRRRSVALRISPVAV